MKPVLAVDIDGTLGNYHTHFTNFCAAYFQREFPYNYDGAEDFEDYLMLTRDEYRAAKLAYRQGGMKRSMTPYAGAAKLLTVADVLGLEIWVATTRPYQRLDNIDPDTRFWMARWEFRYHAMLYGDDKYDQLAMHVSPDRVVMVIDDLYAQAVKADTYWPNQTFLVQRKHNEADREEGLAGTKWCPKIIDMSVADVTLFDQADQWRRKHAR